MLGKIFKNILIFLLGMIFGVVAIFGGGYLLASKVKLGTITETVDKEGQYIGEELKEYTIIEAISLFSDTSKTIGDYQELLPILKKVIQDNLNKEEVKQFVTIDFDKLNALTFETIGSGISSAISVTLSFNALKGLLGFELPNLPIFTSTKTYVKITNEQFEISPFYLDATKYPDIYYLDGQNYVNAYDGETLKSQATGVELYYLSAGISDIPVTDAITALSGALDMEAMTFGELKDVFGIDIIGSGDTLVSKILSESDTLNGISTTLETNVDKLTLADLSIDLPDGIISKILDENAKIGELRGSAGYTAIDFESKINAISIADLGMSLTGIAGKVILPSDTIGGLTDGTVNINDRINGIELGANGLGLNFSGLLGNILQESDTIGGLTNGTINIESRIDGLTLGSLGMSIPTDGVVSKILNENMTVGDLKSKDFNADINALTIADLGIAIDGLAGKIVYSTDKIGELSGASGYTAISFSDRINALTLGDFGVTLDGLAGKILAPTDKIGDLTNGTININDKINALTLGVDGLGLNFTGLMAEILKPNDTIGGLTDGTVNINDRVNALTLDKIGLNLTGIAGKILSGSDTIGGLSGATGYTQININDKVNALTIEDLGLNLGGMAGIILLPTDTIGNLSNGTIDLNGRINGMTLGDFIDLSSSTNPLLQTLNGVKISELESKLTSLTVIDVYGESTEGVFAEVQYVHNQDGTLKLVDGEKVPTLISDIDEEIKFVKLTAMVSEEDMHHNAILEYLEQKGTTLNSLASDMETIKLQDVFTYEVFKMITPTGAGEHEMRYDSSRRVFTMSIDEHGHHVYSEVFSYDASVDANDDIDYYHVCPEASAWLKIMYNRSGEAHERVYTELDVYLLASEDNADKGIVRRINNVSDSFKDATMQELYEIGFIDSKPSALIMYKTLGEVLALLMQ